MQTEQAEGVRQLLQPRGQFGFCWEIRAAAGGEAGAGGGGGVGWGAGGRIRGAGDGITDGAG